MNSVFSMCVTLYIISDGVQIDADTKMMVIGRGGVPITMWGMWWEIQMSWLLFIAN